jgi:hypothetical protein
MSGLAEQEKNVINGGEGKEEPERERESERTELEKYDTMSARLNGEQNGGCNE